jgi:hypothetical protein
MDRNELPGVLRGSSNLGLVAMGSIAVAFGFELADRLPWDGGFDLMSIIQWSNSIAIYTSHLAVFAAITSVPTSWCLIWGRVLRSKQG